MNLREKNTKKGKESISRSGEYVHCSEASTSEQRYCIDCIIDGRCRSANHKKSCGEIHDVDGGRANDTKPQANFAVSGSTNKVADENSQNVDVRRDRNSVGAQCGCNHSDYSSSANLVIRNQTRMPVSIQSEHSNLGIAKSNTDCHDRNGYSSNENMIDKTNLLQQTGGSGLKTKTNGSGYSKVLPALCNANPLHPRVNTTLNAVHGYQDFESVKPNQYTGNNLPSASTDDCCVGDTSSRRGTCVDNDCSPSGCWFWDCCGNEDCILQQDREPMRPRKLDMKSSWKSNQCSCVLPDMRKPVSPARTYTIGLDHTAGVKDETTNLQIETGIKCEHNGKSFSEPLSNHDSVRSSRRDKFNPRCDFLLVGGIDGSRGNFNAGSMILGYNLEQNSWRKFGRMPEAKSNHTAFILQGWLYVVGGLTTASETSRQVTSTNFRFQIPATEALESESEFRPIWQKMADLKLPRISHASVCLKGNAYAIGGRCQDRRITSSVERYSPSTNEWTLVCPLPVALTGLAAAAVSGCIFTFGGLTSTKDGGAQSTRLVFRYNPVQDHWEEWVPLPVVRSYLQSVVTDTGQVWLVGGNSAGHKKDADTRSEKAVLSYDPGTGKVGEVMDAELLGWKTRRYSAAVCKSGSSILCVGGSSKDKSSNPRIFQDTLVIETAGSDVRLTKGQRLPYPVAGAALVDIRQNHEVATKRCKAVEQQTRSSLKSSDLKDEYRAPLSLSLRHVPSSRDCADGRWSRR